MGSEWEVHWKDLYQWNIPILGWVHCCPLRDSIHDITSCWSTTYTTTCEVFVMYDQSYPALFGVSRLSGPTGFVVLIIRTTSLMSISWNVWHSCVASTNQVMTPLTSCHWLWFLCLQKVYDWQLAVKTKYTLLHSVEGVEALLHMEQGHLKDIQGTYCC